ncbi:hypothetical protein A7981_10755 [Methylovorus sp. MM2]|uniref:glycosyltransferase n=1 Tax=Methylovorus sp. MM2 TaxID=1848038 RepID=UPI0007E1BC41|nr:glycosyltransferase [Methylovorus sp. MM2]OAM51210.1 hypothetical protein A7981_10755 [Methylovorus sp. MM2]
MKSAVFRFQLFKPSETFVVSQMRHFQSTQTTLFGGRLFGKAPENVDYFVPSTMGISELIRFYALSDCSMFQKMFDQKNFDLIHAHFSIDGLLILPLARSLNLPLVTTLHGFDVSRSRASFLSSGRPALMRYALFQDSLKQEGDLFICVSEFIKNKALEAGFPEKKLITHYIGIDPDDFRQSPQEHTDLRVVHIARLVEKKGTEYLIKAFQAIVKKYPEAQLIIIGDGPLKESLQSLAAPIANNVQFKGSQPHAFIREELSKASVLVLPSVTASNGDAEGLGLVLLEAAASGVPVVGTRHGGIPEAVVNDENGYLVAERDVSQLAEALDALLASDALRSRFGLAGRELVNDKFNIKKQSRLLEDIYSQSMTLKASTGKINA